MHTFLKMDACLETVQIYQIQRSIRFFWLCLNSISIFLRLFNAKLCHLDKNSFSMHKSNPPPKVVIGLVCTKIKNRHSYGKQVVSFCGRYTDPHGDEVSVFLTPTDCLVRVVFFFIFKCNSTSFQPNNLMI